MSVDQIGLLSDPTLQQNWTKTTCGSEIFSYLRADTLPSEEHPLLILLHGYPQTSYIWRHLVPLLPPSYPLFIPDLPGYGRSSPSLTTHDKLTIGIAILEALRTILDSRPSTRSTSPIPIIFIGHDRGARIAHRLSLTFSHPNTYNPSPNPLPSFALHGLTLLDIAPELAQWATFASPAASASSFHWPFLANADLATAMIEAYGPRRWCAMLLSRWSGSVDDHDFETGSSPRIARFKDGGAVEAYCSAFERPGVVRATCEDYAASVYVEKEIHESDEREGRKVVLSGSRRRGVLVVYSRDYMGQKGKRDVLGIWKRYVDEGTKLVGRGIGDGTGHYLPEEAPEEVAETLVEWLEGRA